MQRLLYLILGLIVFFNAFSQQDPEAKKILDQFAAKTKSFSAFRVDFTINSENLQTKEVATQKGAILIKGDKYVMNLDEAEIYCDGKSIWNYLKKSNEVSITRVSKNKKSDDLDSPSKIFNLYNADFKYRYLGDKEERGKQCYEVDLYPFDIQKPYSSVRLHIDKSNLELVSAKITEKSGIHITISIDKFIPDNAATDKEFVFDSKKHPGVEITDLRD
jgi:outer membrane lipoprotein carrier protein